MEEWREGGRVGGGLSGWTDGWTGLGEGRRARGLAVKLSPLAESNRDFARVFTAKKKKKTLEIQTGEGPGRRSGLPVTTPLTGYSQGQNSFMRLASNPRARPLNLPIPRRSKRVFSPVTGLTIRKERRLTATLRHPTRRWLTPCPTLATPVDASKRRSLSSSAKIAEIKGYFSAIHAAATRPLATNYISQHMLKDTQRLPMLSR